MSVTPHWGANDYTSPGGMSAWDGSSQVTASAPWSYNFGTLVTANAKITGMAVYSESQLLGAWSVTYDATISGPVSAGGTPGPNGGTYSAEYYDGSWHVAASGTFLYTAPQTTITGDFLGVLASRVRVLVTYDYGHNFPGHSGSGSAIVYLSSLVVDASSTIISIPQGSSGQPYASGSSSPTHLWEIYRNGAWIDSGDRYDRFGLFGWAVEPTGAGYTVYVPYSAAIGTGYELYTAGTAYPFTVTPASPPDPPLDTQVHPMFTFSTGLFTTYRKLAAPILSRQSIGSPPANTGALGNLLDVSPATTANLTYTNGTNRQYLICDLGASVSVGMLQLARVTGAVTVYAHTSLITSGSFGAATQLTADSANPGSPSSSPLRFTAPAGADIGVTARYVYVVPNSATVTIGDLDIRGLALSLATLQDITITPSIQTAEIFGPSWVNKFAEADAQFNASLIVTASWASFAAGALGFLLGSDAVVTDGWAEITATATQSTAPFSLELEGRTVEGKRVYFNGYDFRADSTQIPFKQEAFAIPNFKCHARLRDVTGPVYRIRQEL